ncbi:hypothetical protein [Roseomonas marmotae]|nr:hypothetical protein [Roseomonas marmotae]
MRRLATATIRLFPRPLASALLLAAPLGLAPPPAAAQAVDTYGPWLLTCATDSMTDRQRCRMTHETPVEAATAGQSAMALEVVMRDGMLVPAVTARDLGLETAGRGLLAFTGTAQVRFPPNPMMEMPCRLEGRSVICAPRREDLPRAAQELSQASRALVRLTGLGAGGTDAEPKALRLDRTAEALAAFRARVPPGAATQESEQGFDLRDVFLRLQQFFFPQQ